LPYISAAIKNVGEELPSSFTRTPIYMFQKTCVPKNLLLAFQLGRREIKIVMPNEREEEKNSILQCSEIDTHEKVIKSELFLHLG